MSNIPELFGSLVFNDTVQQKRLPHDTYRRLRQMRCQRGAADPDVADVIANVMKAWALDHGVTHFTHWFQPMTGITAEKHDSFLTPAGDGVIMEFFRAGAHQGGAGCQQLSQRRPAGHL